MVQLYHYTDSEGIDGITKSGKIRAVVPHGGESNMPRGVYFTELPPRTSTKKLVINNYDDMRQVLNDTKLLSKLEFWILIDSKDFPEVQRRPTTRNEWIIENDVDLGDCLDYGQRAGKMSLGYGNINGYVLT